MKKTKESLTTQKLSCYVVFLRADILSLRQTIVFFPPIIPIDKWKQEFKTLKIAFKSTG